MLNYAYKGTNPKKRKIKAKTIRKRIWPPPEKALKGNPLEKLYLFHKPVNEDNVQTQGWQTITSAEPVPWKPKETENSSGNGNFRNAKEHSKMYGEF